MTEKTWIVKAAVVLSFTGAGQTTKAAEHIEILNPAEYTVLLLKMYNLSLSRIVSPAIAEIAVRHFFANVDGLTSLDIIHKWNIVDFDGLYSRT